MLPTRAWTLLLLIGTAALAGCVGEQVPGADPQADADEGVDSLDANATADVGVDLIPTLSADVVNGTAPLLVNLTLEAEGADDNTTWSIDFGDGNSTEGVGLPASVNHTFGAGNHTINATVVRGNQTSTTSLAIDVAEAAGEVAADVPPPEVLEFSYPESLGCAGDVLGIAGQHCLSAGSPGDSGIDGFWQELGASYWGLSFTTTAGNVLGDSDCFFTDADLNVVGEANNGSGPCEGEVPEGTVWMFLYSYAEPSTGQTLSFSL